ncbi:MAG: hypothetical protein ABIC91_03115 [Nanoarchaeota archaeon]|nr:hypothetical protein [Nanoarchaeota archaeon]MBU1030085.1 hypothetical protein [Nanoarchaeota archaeon]MBU1849953.1 hypothetical protein [Nanoarchaeota archaeon]
MIKMEEQLFFEEEEELQRIRSSENEKKDVSSLNRKNVSKWELDEIFCGE